MNTDQDSRFPFVLTALAVPADLSYVRDNGVDSAVINAVDDIVQGLYDATRELS